MYPLPVTGGFAALTRGTPTTSVSSTLQGR
nr:MAG TPA: hypothetical protein [Caudoviricetes sp.]